MKKIHILWVDDEIDLLNLHVVFLEEKGYKVTTATNGADAIELIRDDYFDIIFLDENMPGLSGLETLGQIKNISPNVPIIMITKSEEENIMDKAIGSKISDYLIKPVNPKQILLSIKKNVDTKRLVTEKTTADYQSEFSKLGFEINECRNFEDWASLYKKLIFWELELDKSGDNAMDDVLKMQKTEANSAFSKFIKSNYLSWFSDSKDDEKPLISPQLFKQKVLPLLNDNKQVYFIVIDNLRLDQWKTIEPEINQYFRTEEDDLYLSILPTSTHYARNAIFSGLMPSEIEKLFPDYWLNDDEEGNKNSYERQFLEKQLARHGKKIKFEYEKINNYKTGEKIVENLSNYDDNQLVALVYNFIDMLSHARTESEMIKQLANDETAFRSLAHSWFTHSPLFELLKQVSSKGASVFITTDHGTIRVQNALKVIGDRKTTANLRYKQGRNLNYNPKEVFAMTKPGQAYLPASNISSSYIFAMNNDFFAYPNNYHHYVKYYKDTFQHGGISLEEMIVPAITLKSK